MAARKTTSKKTTRPKAARTKAATAKTARSKTTAKKATPRKSARKKSTAKKTAPLKTARKRGASATTRGRTGWKKPATTPGTNIDAAPAPEVAGGATARPAGESELAGRGPSWWSRSLDATVPGSPVAPEYRRELEDPDPTPTPSSTPIPVGIFTSPTQSTAQDTAVEDPDAIEPEVSEDDDPQPHTNTPAPDLQTLDPPSEQPAPTAAADPIVDEVELRPKLMPQVVLPPDTAAPEPSEPEAPETEETAAPETPPVDIAALDTALAAEVEDLLQGDCESVDELLDSAFDEPVPQTIEPPAASDVPPAILEDDVPAVVEPHEFLETIDTGGDAGQEPSAAQQPTPTPAVVPESDPVTEPSAADDAPEPTEPTEPTEPPQPSELSESPEPTESKESVSQPAPGKPPLIITVLQRVNYPMRLLPRSTRVIVDWVAWSLILWVPVVWVIAILVIGR